MGEFLWYIPNTVRVEGSAWDDVAAPAGRTPLAQCDRITARSVSFLVS